MEEGNACEIINGESDAKSSIYVKVRVSQSKIMNLSEKQERERES